MEHSNDHHVLTISGKRETIIDNSDNKDSKKDSNSESSSNKENNSGKYNNEHVNENKEANKEENNKKYSRIEFSFGKFSQSFAISENTDINNIKIKMKYGVLEVIINKIETQKKEHRRSIQIQ
ncbi:hypothetical protein H8356DRAFT_1360527 [Neocallimastix lanati (nom. inval.)]|nr:hypothetical protein H8356DRAFT_1360527 [Neocallimastix sp. JGI-2020a]